MLVRLLRVFRTGSLADLETACKEAGGDGEGGVLALCGSSVDSLRESMRVLLLAALCHCTLGRALGFAEVVSELGLEAEGEEGDDQAEEWVLEAVRQGLIEARVDEVDGMVRVTRAVPRSVGASARASAKQVLLAMKAAVDTLEGGAFAGTGRDAAMAAAVGAKASSTSTSGKAAASATR